MKTRHLNYLRTLQMLCLSLLFLNCSDNDDTAMAAWELEIAQLERAMIKYANIAVATDEGFIDVSGFVPNMGHHYLLPSRADATFELEKPEILLYAPNSSGTMEFVAVEYIVPVADPDNPGTPPEGFTGTLDMWEFNMERSQWQLHVWIVKENPDGIFAPFNETIGTGN